MIIIATKKRYRAHIRPITMMHTMTLVVTEVCIEQANECQGSGCGAVRREAHPFNG